MSIKSCLAPSLVMIMVTLLFYMQIKVIPSQRDEHIWCSKPCHALISQQDVIFPHMQYVDVMMQDHIYCPVTSREETSLLVSYSTIQGLHIKQENRVRDTFTLPLVNTPDHNTRNADLQEGKPAALWLQTRMQPYKM